MILLPCLEAREISLWPYDRLHKEADLIIVGVPEKSADTGELVRGMLWQRDFPGVNTIFNVTGVLKGRYKASSITLFHLRQPDNGILDNGPYLASFNHQPIIQPLPGGKRRSTKQEYLLFLKKRDDGRYEPVSGPMDSAHAIREMNMAINAQ